MKKMIEVSDKKVDSAIAKGLEILGLTLDDVDVKVVSQGGFLKKAKVEIYYGAEIDEKPSAKTQADEKQPAKTEVVEKQPAKTEVVEKQPAKTEVVEKQPAKTEKQQKKQPEQKSQPLKAEKTEKPATQKKENISQPDKKESQKDFTKTANAVQSVANDQKQNVTVEKGESEKSKKKEKRGKHVRECIQPNDAQVKDASEFLTKTVQLMGIDAKIELKVDDGIRFDIVTEDARVIGHRGEVLDALQYLTSMVINGDNEKYVHVSTDALGYRAKRKNSLESLAVRMAEKALKSGRKVVLEPMNSADRRIIHASLSENEKVITRSEGHEPMRRIVILPKKNK